MTPLGKVFAAVLLWGVPMARSLELEDLRRGNQSSLWKDVTEELTMDDDDTPSSKPPPGPLGENLVVEPAPVIGATEMASPWGPAELVLAQKFKEWPGSENLLMSYEKMQGMPELVEGLVERSGLPEVEALALFAVGMTDTHHLNDVLRGYTYGYEDEEVEMAGVISQLATKALEKLPSLGGSVLWRGTSLPLGSIKTLKDENYFYEPGFLSASPSSKAAGHFALQSQGDDDFQTVILQIICPPPGAPLPQCRGKDVNGFALGNDPVLFPPGTKFAKVGEGDMLLDTEFDGQHQFYAFVVQPWL